MGLCVHADVGPVHLSRSFLAGCGTRDVIAAQKKRGGDILNHWSFCRFTSGI